MGYIFLKLKYIVDLIDIQKKKKYIYISRYLKNYNIKIKLKDFCKKKNKIVIVSHAKGHLIQTVQSIIVRKKMHIKHNRKKNDIFCSHKTSLQRSYEFRNVTSFVISLITSRISNSVVLFRCKAVPFPTTNAFSVILLFKNFFRLLNYKI